MTDRELMQMALDALEAALSNDQPYISRSEETAEALRARLAQPEQEPVAWITTWNEPNNAGAELHWAKQDKGLSSKHTPLFYKSFINANCEPVAWLYKTNNTWDRVSFVEPPDDAYDEGSLRPVYLAPPQREWQGLTEMEKIEIQMLKWWDWEDTFDLDGYTRAIEAKLKEKNSA